MLIVCVFERGICTAAIVCAATTNRGVLNNIHTHTHTYPILLLIYNTRYADGSSDVAEQRNHISYIRMPTFRFFILLYFVVLFGVLFVTSSSRAYIFFMAPRIVRNVVVCIYMCMYIHNNQIKHRHNRARTHRSMCPKSGPANDNLWDVLESPAKSYRVTHNAFRVRTLCLRSSHQSTKGIKGVRSSCCGTYIYIIHIYICASKVCVFVVAIFRLPATVASSCWGVVWGICIYGRVRMCDYTVIVWFCATHRCIRFAHRYIGLFSFKRRRVPSTSTNRSREL